jgi:hypothetical protein
VYRKTPPMLKSRVTADASFAISVLRKVAGTLTGIRDCARLSILESDMGV